MRSFVSALCLFILITLSQAFGDPIRMLQPTSVRDEAEGVPASLATPAQGAVVANSNTRDDASLEEFLRYQIEQQKDWKLRLFASGNLRHDSNLFLSKDNPESDNMWTARPGFQYSYGQDNSTLQFLLDGAMEFNHFEKFTDQNSVNTFVSTSLTYRLKKIEFKFNGNFTDVTGGDTDVGGQAQRTQITPNLQMTYNASQKIRVGLGSQIRMTDYDGLISSASYQVGSFVDYAFLPQFRLGFQIDRMWQEVDVSGSQTGQNYLLRLEWNGYKKISASGTMGIQTLHTSGGEDVILPLGSLGLKYDVGPKTSVRASVYAASQSSPSLAGQYFQSNGVILGVEQQVGRKLNIGADVGFEMSKYSSYSDESENSREDELMFFRPWLKYTLQTHLSLQLFYQYSSNTSSGVGAQDFERGLYGVGLTTSW